MTVGLGDIKADDGVSAVEVSAPNYDAPQLMIGQDDDCVVLTRKQLQALSVIIDQFMDR